MTKFIVHIGDGKCGSSAIQASLFEGRTQLREKGLYYESHARTAGNYCLVTLTGQQTRGNDAEQRDLALQQIASMAANAAENEYIVLSNEALLQIGPEATLDVLRRISPQIESIEAIAYVREPSNMYLSILQQTLKASHAFPRPNTYLRPVHAWLGAWQAHPAIDNLTVRLFDRTTLHGGSTVADFAQVLGDIRGNHAITLADQEQNSSLFAEQMVVLRDFRHRFCHRQNNKSTPETVRLMRLFEALNAAGLRGSKLALVPEAKALVQARHAETVRALAERYGIEMDTQVMPEGEIERLMERDWSSLSDLLAEVSVELVHRLKLFIPRFNPAIVEASDTTIQAMSNDFARYISADEPRIAAILKAYRDKEASVL